MSRDTPATAPDANLPIGTVVAWFGNQANLPTNWGLCDGKPVDDAFSDYKSLIGPNKPDLGGLSLVGSGPLSSSPSSVFHVDLKKMGQQGGAETVTLSADQMPTHKHYGFGEHYQTWPFGVSGTGQPGSAGGYDSDNSYYGTTDAGGDKPHENRPPYCVVHYIIYLGERI